MQKSKNLQSRQAGFTLIETLILMAVASIPLLFVFGSITNIFKSQSVSSNVESLQQTMLTIMSDISQQMSWSSDAMIGNGGEELTLTSSKPDQPAQVSYKLVDGVLLKNGERLTGDDVIVKKFLVSDHAAAQRPALLQIEVVFEARSTAKVKPTIEKTFYQSIRVRELNF